MALTKVRSQDLQDGQVSRADLNISGSTGSTVISKIINGTGISISSTGTDAGTGDVTISVNPSSISHGSLGNLTSADDHSQYIHMSYNRTITATHTFNPASSGAPFLIGANASGQKVTNLNVDMVDGYHFNQSLLTNSGPSFANVQFPTSDSYIGYITGVATGPDTGFVSIGDNNFGADIARFSDAGISVMDGDNVHKIIISHNGDTGIINTDGAGIAIQKQYSCVKYTNTTNTINWNNSNVQYKVLSSGGNTFTFSAPLDGGRYIFIIKQPSSGSAGTVTWPSTVKWQGGTIPTLTATNNAVDMFSFIYDATNGHYYGNYSLNF